MLRAATACRAGASAMPGDPATSSRPQRSRVVRGRRPDCGALEGGLKRRADETFASTSKADAKVYGLDEVADAVPDAATHTRISSIATTRFW